uniref:Uncharacterized protein n=1 Tax=Panagrolaimus davidi TaxID=227884 RepID=A0A914PH14_9BILA
MSTKNDKDSFIEQSFTTSKNQYYNLNLNQSKKCPISVSIQSNSKSNNDKYCGTAATYFIVSDNYEEKEKLQSWNKSSKASTFTTVNEDNDDLKKRWKNENTLNTINKGTVALRIAAFENLKKASSDSLNKSFQKSWLIQKQKQLNPASTFVSQNLFKFHRQQNDKVPEPEVSQFKTSNSQGVEIDTRRSATTTNCVPKHCLIVPEEQIYLLQQYLYEAKHRETQLGQKLTVLQETLNKAHEASETNWQAMINEERLLSRIETLESQLSLLSTSNSIIDDPKSSSINPLTLQSSRIISSSDSSTTDVSFRSTLSSASSQESLSSPRFEAAKEGKEKEEDPKAYQMEFNAIYIFLFAVFSLIIHRFIREDV